MSEKVAPIRGPSVVAEVGGPVDEFRVTLALYGDNLNPEIVSQLLSCNPTDAHSKGERKGPRSPPFTGGAWLLTAEGKAPASPSDAIESLLGRFPPDVGFWKGLNDDFKVQLRIGIHTAGWNRGFHISPRASTMIAVTGASIEFDLYFYGEHDV